MLLHGADVWVPKGKETFLETTEIEMLRRIKGVTLRDRERSDKIRSGKNHFESEASQFALAWKHCVDG